VLGGEVAEGEQRLLVAGHAVVVGVPSQDAGKPATLLGDRLVPASHQLGLDRAELGLQPPRVGDPLEFETPLLGLRAGMREAEKAELLRPAKPTRLAIPGGEPTELDQARLLGVELQAELRKPAAKVRPEPLRVITVLEAHHGVVGETHDHDISVRVPTPPLMNPQVEDVMRVDVAEQRRSRSPLRNALLERRPRPLLDDPRAEPFLDQAQNPLVRDPVLNEPLRQRWSRREK
jgi:hypothetical protein